MEPCIIHVSGSVYAIVCEDNTEVGQLTTVTIHNNGVIGGVIDTSPIDTPYGRDPCILHISGDVYAIVHRGQGTDGFIDTVPIYDDGTIGAHIMHYEYNTTSAVNPHIIHVSQDVYAIVYSNGQDDNGWLTTIRISDDGTIHGNIGSYKFNTRGEEPYIIHISQDVYAIVYQTYGDNGHVDTVTIHDDGTIDGLINNYEFETNSTWYPRIINIHDTVYGIIRGGAGGGVNYLKTVTIQDNGIIPGNIASFLIDAGQAMYADIVPISGDVYAIVYGIHNVDGMAKTVVIKSDGVISGPISGYEFESSPSTYPRIIHVSGDVYVIVYNIGNSGWIKTISIKTGSQLSPPRFTSGLSHRSVH